LETKIIYASIVFFVIGSLYLYYDPFDNNRTIYEDLKWAVERERAKPIEATERLAGIPSQANLFDDQFTVEEFVTGLDRPTSMTFVGDDIIILEKNYGKVRLVRDGILQKEPILDVEVNSLDERGLLGITSIDSDVYLYFTKAEHDGGPPLGNYIYKYTWNGEQLIDPVLVNSLPSMNPRHNGGSMIVDKNRNVYAVVGDQTTLYQPPEEYRILQNVPYGKVDDTGIILRVGINISEISPMQSQSPFDHYYAIGIRNSFGITVDPVTGNIWDTENGEDTFDEVNLVLPKFNSGWVITMGPATTEELSKIPQLENFTYSDPEFSWERPVAPTALTFVTSDKFQKYKNDLLVGDCNHGNIYRFELNQERTGFVFTDLALADLVVNTIQVDGEAKKEPMDEILFGTGFGCITDLEFGPDDSLYVASISSGAIYRIIQ